MGEAIDDVVMFQADGGVDIRTGIRHGQAVSRAAIFVQLENALAIAGDVGFQFAHDLLANFPQGFRAFGFAPIRHRLNIVGAISAIAASNYMGLDFFGRQHSAA